MKDIFSNIGSPENKNYLNNFYGTNSDIIKAVNSALPSAVKETELIAPYFKGKTPKETALKIWSFLKSKVNYVKDTPGYQFVKLPRRFLDEKQGDCKSFSVFTAGILKNIYPKAEIFLRYASYTNINIPTHVYTIMFYNNEIIIIDAVYKYFNKEKQFKHKQDYKMKIYTLSGFEDETINGRKKGRIKSAIKKAAGQVKKAAGQVKSGVKKATAAVKKGGIKTVALAAPRAAFLGLLLVNLKGLASKILKADQTNPAKLKSFWEKLGGNYDQLIQAAKKGGNKKPIGYIPEDDEEIGSAAAVGTAIATASPIIVSILALLKQILPKKEYNESGETADLEEKANKEAVKTAAETGTETAAGEEATATATGEEKNFFEKNKILVIGGAAALALFFIMKKK
jgi:hypothetical protein